MKFYSLKQIADAAVKTVQEHPEIIKDVISFSIIGAVAGVTILNTRSIGILDTKVKATALAVNHNAMVANWTRVMVSNNAYAENAMMDVILDHLGPEVKEAASAAGVAASDAYLNSIGSNANDALKALRDYDQCQVLVKM